MRRLLLSILVLLALPTILPAQQTERLEKLDQYFTELNQYQKFMGSVAVIENGELIYSRAVGNVNENGEPASPDALYRIGSITKSYTAAMVMKLAEEGKLSLDDSLADFFPDLPNAESITIEHLLRHRSGLTNFTSLSEYMDYYTQETSRGEMLDRFEALEGRFEPGSQFEYSNTGYVLLGYIIEDVSGMSYGEALDSMIAEPLGLENTYYGFEISMESGLADSYIFTGDSWSLSPSTYMFIPHGAGAIVATAPDVAEFFEALLNGELLREASLERMTQFQDGYGLGLTRIPFYERSAIGHNGGIDGFQSSAATFRQDDLSFAILANGVNEPLNVVAIGVLSILFERDFDIPDFSAEPDQVTLSEAQQEAFVGSYSSEDIPLEISVFLQGGTLMAQATGQGAFPLTSYEGGIMKFQQAGIEMAFDSMSEGKYQSFELRQAGQIYRFTRKAE